MHYTSACVAKHRDKKATEPDSKAATKAATVATEHSGDVLDVVRTLLEGDRKDAVLGVVAKLLASNTELVTKNVELERRLAQLLTRGFKNNEGVSANQLLLFLNDLLEGNVVDAANREIADANEKLRLASGIDEIISEKEEDPETRPKPQPPLRKPPPPNLRRVDNPIRVASGARPCPTCGRERNCIGHDITEVIELIPAELIVRRDMREKLACDTCEGEIVRAPVGDKVVSGGKLGSRLVADLVVDKYSDGLPLHRQKERFARLGAELSVSTLADQVTWSTDLLRPLWRAAIAQVLAATVMHLDATGLPVQDREVEGSTRLGTLWDTSATKTLLLTSTRRRERKRDSEPMNSVLRTCWHCAKASPLPMPQVFSIRASSVQSSWSVDAICTDVAT